MTWPPFLRSIAESSTQIYVKNYYLNSSLITATAPTSSAGNLTINQSTRKDSPKNLLIYNMHTSKDEIIAIFLYNPAVLKASIITI
ncbi:hypothetical protein DPV78_001849 [Talaromyces pinophilus]|nr:hypothetical protein DPV78_001849 [Talaromyces pinophilus]